MDLKLQNFQIGKTSTIMVGLALQLQHKKLANYGVITESSKITRAISAYAYARARCRHAPALRERSSVVGSL